MGQNDPNMGRGEHRNQTVLGTPRNHVDHHVQGVSTLTFSACRIFKMTDGAAMTLIGQQTRCLPCSERASLACSREAPTMGLS